MEIDKKENFLLRYIFCASPSRMWSEEDGDVKIQYCRGVYERAGSDVVLHNNFQYYTPVACVDCGNSKFVIDDLWKKAEDLKNRLFDGIETPMDMAEVLRRMGEVTRQCPKSATPDQDDDFEMPRM